MTEPKPVTTSAKVRWLIAMPFTLLWAAGGATAYWFPFLFECRLNIGVSIGVLTFWVLYTCIFAGLLWEWCERGAGGIEHD